MKNRPCFYSDPRKSTKPPFRKNYGSLVSPEVQALGLSSSQGQVSPRHLQSLPPRHPALEAFPPKQQLNQARAQREHLSGNAQGVDFGTKSRGRETRTAASVAQHNHHNRRARQPRPAVSPRTCPSALCAPVTGLSGAEAGHGRPLDYHRFVKTAQVKPDTPPCLLFGSP